MKQMMMILTAFAVTAMMFMSACGDTAKTQYEIKYSRTYGTAEVTQNILPHTDKVDEGTIYTTKRIFPSDSYSNLFGEIDSDRNMRDTFYFDLGYKKFKVTKGVHIFVGDRAYTRFSLPWKFTSPRIFYTLQLDENSLEFTQEYSYERLPFTPPVKFMKGTDGGTYKITEWKDDRGKVYRAGVDAISTTEYPDRHLIILYSSKRETEEGKLLQYNGNGNTSGKVPESGVFSIGTEQTIPGNTGSLIKTGYAFLGWNTAVNGTGTTYAAGQKITMSADITLYAKWGKSVAVNFDPNFPTSGIAPAGTVTGNTTLQHACRGFLC